MSRALTAILCAVTVLGLGACESNQDRSAAIAKQGKHAIAAGNALKVDATSRDVRVISTTLINGDGGAQAVAVKLHNSGGAQGDVPVLLQAGKGAGEPLYTNATAGTQPSLQRIALVASGTDTWWVDDQVMGAPDQQSLSVKIGAGRPVTKVPEVTATGLKLTSDPGGTFLTGTLTNRSGAVQSNLPIFGVGLKGGKVVAAGRSLVASLPAASTPVPTAFQMFFIGDPTGTKIAVSVAPTSAAG